MTLDTILVVDDEAAQRDALSDYFSNVIGYNVLTAASADEAVELLKSLRDGLKMQVLIFCISAMSFIEIPLQEKG